MNILPLLLLNEKRRQCLRLTGMPFASTWKNPDLRSKPRGIVIFASLFRESVSSRSFFFERELAGHILGRGFAFVKKAVVGPVDPEKAVIDKLCHQ
jgi:hypothetical protein